MNENVVKFFEIYNADEALRQRLLDAEANYPGSIEIRENVVEEVLLPVAKEMGFEFTVMDLFVYESRLKNEMHQDEEIDPDAEDDETTFWLVDHGWTNAESKFCGDKE